MPADHWHKVELIITLKGYKIMIKQVMTQERAQRINTSIKVMAIMAQIIQIEYQCDMDVDLKNPMANQFAGRIIKDCRAIEYHLKTKQSLNIKFDNVEFVEEIAAELHRVIHYFIHLPLSQIKEVMDNLDNVTQIVEA